MRGGWRRGVQWQGQGGGGGVPCLGAQSLRGAVVEGVPKHHTRREIMLP